MKYFSPGIDMLNNSCNICLWGKDLELEFHIQGRHVLRHVTFALEPTVREIIEGVEFDVVGSV